MTAMEWILVTEIIVLTLLVVLLVCLVLRGRMAYGQPPYQQNPWAQTVYAQGTVPVYPGTVNPACYGTCGAPGYYGGRMPAAGDDDRGPRYVGGPGPAANKQGARSRARWRVDFMEMSSGRQVSRDFRDELIVGRQMPAPLESGRLYLSMDATVSRAQFCLYVTDRGVMIENLSQVNVTRKNGYPIWQPVLLQEGDILEMGRMRYMVKGIRPAA